MQSWSVATETRILGTHSQPSFPSSPKLLQDAYSQRSCLLHSTTAARSAAASAYKRLGDLNSALTDSASPTAKRRSTCYRHKFSAPLNRAGAINEYFYEAYTMRTCPSSCDEKGVLLKKVAAPRGDHPEGATPGAGENFTDVTTVDNKRVHAVVLCSSFSGLEN